jgi:hypothetical protein
MTDVTTYDPLDGLSRQQLVEVMEAANARLQQIAGRGGGGR